MGKDKDCSEEYTVDIHPCWRTPDSTLCVEINHRKHEIRGRRFFRKENKRGNCSFYIWHSLAEYNIFLMEWSVNLLKQGLRSMLLTSDHCPGNWRSLTHFMYHVPITWIWQWLVGGFEPQQFSHRSFQDKQTRDGDCSSSFFILTKQTQTRSSRFILSTDWLDPRCRVPWTLCCWASPCTTPAWSSPPCWWSASPASTTTTSTWSLRRTLRRCRSSTSTWVPFSPS